MSQRSRFFDSVGGDRVYTSDAWAQVIQALMGDGVASGREDELVVTESSPQAMSVNVGLGSAFVQGRYFEVYSAAETLAIAAANPSNPRIDRVVVRLDPTARTCVLAVLTGTAAASPTAPALTQTPGGTWELPLAQVAVAALAGGITNANITSEAPTAAPVNDLVHAGDIKITGRTAAPAGWLLCQGQTVSRTTYADLFAAIGTTYGAGDGSTTFALPDLRGRFPLGKAASGTGSSLGSTGGSIDHTHTGPSHTHATDTIGSPDSTELVNNMVAGTKVAVGSGSHGHIAGDQVTTAGGTGATGTGNAPFLSVNYIIKT